MVGTSNRPFDPLQTDETVFGARGSNSLASQAATILTLTVTNDLARLQQTAAKHEFQSLNRSVRALLVQNLKPLAVEFAQNGISIQVTHESWVQPPTRDFARQLVDILREADFHVADATTATVYLCEEPQALEWGFSPEQQSFAQELLSALMRIIEQPRPYPHRPLPKGSVRLHFGGRTVFEPNGTVRVE